MGSRWWCAGEESACPSRRCKRPRFHPWVRKIPWRRTWQPTPVLLPGGSQGQRSLAGYRHRGFVKTQTGLSAHHNDGYILTF